MPDPQEILIWVIAVPRRDRVGRDARLAHLPLKRERATQPWGPALAIAAGFAAAFVGLDGGRAFPPRDAQTGSSTSASSSVLIAIAATVAARTSVGPG